MGINVGDVETVLSARDTMSPTLVAAAERVAELRLRLAALGSTSTAVAAEIKMSLAQAEEAFKTLAAAASGQTTPAIATTAAGAKAMTDALKGVKIGGTEAAAGMKETDDAATVAGRSLDQTAGMAQRLVERLAILYAIRGVFQFTTNLFEAADALVKMNGQTDMTIGKLQEVQYAAEQTGIPFTKVTTAIDTMDKKMAEAKAGTGDALIGIGLSFQRVFDLNPDQRFDAIVAAIAAMPSQLQRTKAEVEIFGTDALDPMIKRFGDLSDAAHRNNAIMEDDTVRALSNTVRIYRSFWGDVSPIMGQIIDKGQKMVEVLAAPLFGGVDTKSSVALLSSMLTTGGPFNMLAALEANRASTARDIQLPAPGSGGGAGTPLIGQAFIDSLYAQSLATKSLTGEQWVQLQQLRDLNVLTVDNAAKIGVSTVQFKGYEDAIRQWDKEATAAIATQKEWDRAKDNMLATGLDLDTAAPADFLKAGASAKDIQTYYGMAASQVRQLQMDIRAEAKEETEAAREREQAQRQTDAAISRTSVLWDQYTQLTARVEEGSLESRLATVDTWYNHQVDMLNKSTVTEAAYYGNLDALAAVSGAKRAKILNDQHDVDERSLMRLGVEWDQYYQEIEKGTGTTTSIQIAGVQRWFDSEVSRIKASDTYWQAHYDILYATAQAKMDLIIHAQDPLWLAWRGLNADMRVEWAATWEEALNGTGLFVSAIIKPFTDIEHNFLKMVAGMLANWQQSLLQPMITSTNSVMSSMFGISGSSVGGFGSGKGASVAPGTTFASTAAAEDMLASTSTIGFMGAISGGSGGGSTGGTSAGGTMMSGMAGAAVAAGVTAAIMGGVALFKYVFRDRMPEDVARDAGSRFGQVWSDGLRQTVVTNAKKFHDEVTGELMSLPAIIGETPVDDANVFMYEQRVHDLFSMIETGHLTAVQAVTTLDKVFPDLATHATDAYGRISDELREIISLNAVFGTQSKAIADWQKAQAANIGVGFVAVTGAEADQFAEFARIKKAIDDAVDAASDSTLTDKIAVLAGKVDDAQAAYNKLVSGGKGTPAQIAAAQSKIDIARRNLEAANPDINVAMGQQSAAAQANAPMLADLGVQAVGAYVTAVATGSSPAEALKSIGPSLTQIKKAYDDLGLSVDDVVLANLLMQNTIMSGNPALIAGVDGLSKEMVGLDNLGLETVAMFEAQLRTGENMYTRLQDVMAKAGGTTRDALLPMQGYLHQALIEAERLNIPLDDLTQMMIDQSKDAGIWQDNIKPSPTLVGVMGDLRDTVRELVDLLANKMPKQIDIGVGFHIAGPEIPVPVGGGGETPPQAASGALITRGGLVRVHQDEAVISARAVARISNGGSVGAINAGRSTGTGAATVTIGSINVYPAPGTDMADPYAVSAALREAFRTDTNQAYTIVRTIAQRTINEQPILG